MFIRARTCVCLYVSARQRVHVCMCGCVRKPAHYLDLLIIIMDQEDEEKY